MPITIDIADEGPPKRQIIELAFSELAMAGYEFGRTPEEIADALSRLNAMMAEWKGMLGVDLGYDQPHYGVGNPDGLSGIPHETLNTVASFLAMRIAPMMGTELSPQVKANLAMSFALLKSHYAAVPTMPRDSYTPIGGGHRTGVYSGPYFHEKAEILNPPAEDA